MGLRFICTGGLNRCFNQSGEHRGPEEFSELALRKAQEYKPGTANMATLGRWLWYDWNDRLIGAARTCACRNGIRGDNIASASEYYHPGSLARVLIAAISSVGLRHVTFNCIHYTSRKNSTVNEMPAGVSHHTHSILTGKRWYHLLRYR